MSATEVYVSVLDDEDEMELTQVTDEFGVYTDPETRHAQFETQGEEVDLGFRDVTLSRMREEGPPVRLRRTERGVEVINKDNKNDIKVEDLTSIRSLSTGESTHVDSDCLIKPGVNTELRLSVEQSVQTAHSDNSDDSVPYAAINHLCDHFNMTVEKAPSEASEYGRVLFETVQENPLDISTYEQKKEELKVIVDSISDQGSTGVAGYAEDVSEVTKSIKHMYNRN